MAKSFIEIGAALKQEREKKHLKILDIAKSLKIRAGYLEAMEEGRFKDLPGPVYSFGYLKIYCDQLDIKNAEILESFKSLIEAELLSGGMTLQGDPYSHELKPHPGIVMLSLLLMALVYFFWYYAIYFPARLDKEKYSILKEKVLIEKAKELYGTTEDK